MPYHAIVYRHTYRPRTRVKTSATLKCNWEDYDATEWNQILEALKRKHPTSPTGGPLRAIIFWVPTIEVDRTLKAVISHGDR